MSEEIYKIVNELNSKNFKKALELSDKYSKNKDLHILNNLKGIIFINLKDHTKAIEYFEKSIIYKEDYLEELMHISVLKIFQNL